MADKPKLTRAERKQIEAVIRKYRGDGKPHTGFRLVKIRRQGAEHAHRRQFAGDDRKGADPERNDGYPDARRGWVKG